MAAPVEAKQLLSKTPLQGLRPAYRVGEISRQSAIDLEIRSWLECHFS
jgi:hypothetical protein